MGYTTDRLDQVEEGIVAPSRKMVDEEHKTVEESEWLPLSKAAALLGVHSMTLRRWSDSGRFPCSRTAGGHRRFSVKDIDTYLNRSRNALTTEITSSWANRALVETRQKVAHHSQHRWLKEIDEEEMRSEYRSLGHQLMGLLLQYVAAEVPNGSFIDEARHIGRRYGSYGVRAGMSLTSIMEATIFFRDILLESSLQVPIGGYVETDASLRILRRVNQIISAVQLSVTDFYETAGQVSDL